MSGDQWCKIVEHEGEQVLFTHQWNDEKERDEIRCTFRGEPFGLGDVEVTLSLGTSSTMFREEQFLAFAQEEVAARTVSWVQQQAGVA